MSENKIRHITLGIKNCLIQKNRIFKKKKNINLNIGKLRLLNRNFSYPKQLPASKTKIQV